MSDARGEGLFRSDRGSASVGHAVVCLVDHASYCGGLRPRCNSILSTNQHLVNPHASAGPHEIDLRDRTNDEGMAMATGEMAARSDTGAKGMKNHRTNLE